MNVQKMIQNVEKAQGIYDTKNYRYTVESGLLKRKPIGIIGTVEALTTEWEIVGVKDNTYDCTKAHLSSLWRTMCYRPGITDAIPPEEWEEEDPAEVLRDLDERLQLLSQDTADLDPAELWKGFGI